MEGSQVLIVDDNLMNLKLLQLLLAAEGYDVKVAANAEDALALLETETPRLILMDIQLPGIDGLELTRRLKADPKKSGITILAVTAYAMIGDEAKIREAGCDGYLTKPIDTRTLSDVVAGYLVGGSK